MIARNTYGEIEYVWENLCWSLIGFVWYKSLLFRCIASQTYACLRMILITMVAVLVILGIFFNIGRSRNNYSVFANVALPFGVYTAITYASLKMKYIAGVLLVSGFLSAILIIPVFFTKIRYKKKVYTIINRLGIAVAKWQFVHACGLVIVMVGLGCSALFSYGIVRPTDNPPIFQESINYTVEDNLEVLTQLQEERWDVLSVQERIDVLQVVANIETSTLGIPHELNVGAANLGEYTLGGYRNGSHEIILSLDSLETDNAETILNTICHESFHAYQYCLVSVMENAPEEYENLLIFREANKYAAEFNHYQNGRNDFESYYAQKCEKDAREYAENAVNYYYLCIEEYVTSNKPRN